MTPSGAPKIVDVIECTGSGDVSMRQRARIAADATVRGLSGRTLRLSASWAIPSSEVRVAVKRGFDLFPRGLVSRVTAELEKEWDEKHAQLVHSIAVQLESAGAAHPLLPPLLSVSLSHADPIAR